MPRDSWRAWGLRFRKAIKPKGMSLALLADKLGKSESLLRSWTNGNRPTKLNDFFALCEAAEVDPLDVLFDLGKEDFSVLKKAWLHSDRRGRAVIMVAAGAAEQTSEEAAPAADAPSPHERK
jgi:transcriptional regulator with XRE-family HTH domain